MKVILFDGECNLCNSTVQFIIKRDVKNQFKFASLQSSIAQDMLVTLKYESNSLFLSTILLIEDQRISEKSTAILKILKELKGCQWMGFLLWFPKSLRDSAYAIIAKNRYRFQSKYGIKNERCLLPTRELQKKFL